MVDTKVEKTYGSIDGTNEPIVNVDSGGVDGFYFFYKQKDLSKKEKIMKMIKLAVPIIIAVILIGGIAWILFDEFDNIYPSSSSGHRPSSSSINGRIESIEAICDDDSNSMDQKIKNSPPIRGPKTSSISTASTSSSSLESLENEETESTTATTHSNLSASCSSYTKCQKLELTGDCCPTIGGDVLYC